MARTLATLRVELGDRSYPIHIGQQLIDEGELIRPFVRSGQVMIVSNEVVAPFYLERLERSLEGLQVESVVISAVSISSRCPPRCSPRWTPLSVARPGSTIRWART